MASSSTVLRTTTTDSDSFSNPLAVSGRKKAQASPSFEVEPNRRQPSVPVATANEGGTGKQKKGPLKKKKPSKTNSSATSKISTCIFVVVIVISLIIIARCAMESVAILSDIELHLAAGQPTTPTFVGPGRRDCATPGDGGCVASIPKTATVTTKSQVNDVACAGYWSNCTPACETALSRVWMQTVVPRGAGALCPSATFIGSTRLDCASGDGECVVATIANRPKLAEANPTATSVDCAGYWSNCTAACEPAMSRIWMQTMAPSGMGIACPSPHFIGSDRTDCVPDEGNCRRLHTTTFTRVDNGRLCPTGFYLFKHSRSESRCLASSITTKIAGFTHDAVGIYSFQFDGTIPGDIASGSITVPSSAALSLSGTGVEVVKAWFITKPGAQLTLADLSLSISKPLVVTQHGILKVINCSGAISDVSITDSIVIMSPSAALLNMGSVYLYNAGTVNLSRVQFFKHASIDIRSTKCTMSGAILNSNQIHVGSPDIQPQGYLRPVLARGKLSLISCAGVIQNLYVDNSSFLLDSNSSAGILLKGEVVFTKGNNALTAILDVSTVSVSEAARLNVSSSRGKWGMMMVAESTVSIHSSQLPSRLAVIKNSKLTLDSCNGTVSHLVVSESSLVLRKCHGQLSGVRVDGRKDVGPMGACDGTRGVQCPTMPNSPCCSNSGSVEMCSVGQIAHDGTNYNSRRRSGYRNPHRSDHSNPTLVCRQCGSCPWCSPSSCSAIATSPLISKLLAKKYNGCPGVPMTTCGYASGGSIYHFSTTAAQLHEL
eukprot:COSAG01_NODE_7858_length_3024_cov_1.660171_1_plen_774_part_00